MSGADLARKAAADARAEGNNKRNTLGAGALAAAAESTRATAPEPNKNATIPAVTILNAPKVEEAAPSAPAQPAVQAPAKDSPRGKTAAKDKPAAVQTASAAQAARSAAAPAARPAAPAKCNVYTASYGGQKAIIIMASAGEAVNYTVLDVNDGAEKRETEAYIAAYAKGGQAIGEYGTQAQALDKAFELCPEG
jgi:hypothetical protein